MPKTTKPVIENNTLRTPSSSIPLGSPEWFAWLLEHETFSFQGKTGHFTAQRETRRRGAFWYAYRRRDGRLFKHYLGKSEDLSAGRLEQASRVLAGQALLDQYDRPPAGEHAPGLEPRIDTSFLPMTKFSSPALPPHLLSRPRLLRQISAPETAATAPVTLISAPSGFGKSTLLNDWKRSCGFPVAWLALDESDNHLTRFWYSVVLALRALRPGLGEELLNYLRGASPPQPGEVLSRLANDLLGSLADLPRFGLVVDDFQHILLPEVTGSVQAWLEHLPPNMQLVILGHSKPAFSLGSLRALGRVSELDASDLRFTLEEGLNYLRGCLRQAPPLPQSDLEKLVRHSEGWAAGLALTAIALGKQEDPRQFVETFSGAHMYLREYFMETVLQRSSPEVQAFLLQTAILKHMSGSLCDAVTGQSGSETMLARLWQENLFIDRLVEPDVQPEARDWYRYHDLFAEMLRSQLLARFPGEVPLLHQRAAQWYRAQNAPADAVYHLLAAGAWDEAAALIETMALRELEQYGEDSRLLRWLLELPEDVVQKHKTLLFVYLRLAEMALPKQKVERFLARVESNLAQKPAHQRKQEEREVLEEIGRIRRVWEQGGSFLPPASEGLANDARWEVLDGLQLLHPENRTDPALWEEQLTGLLHQAQAQSNLFVVLMTGGVLARLALVQGQLRRSEKIARQVLDQALLQRGRLPEPASIPLAVLSQVSLERGELDAALRSLAQAEEVDPNPTSTNMPVQNAILRAKILAAQGKGEEALATMQAVRELHRRRPSGMWSDLDLQAYEALIRLRAGMLPDDADLPAESDTSPAHALSQLVRAEVLLESGQAEAAEALLTRLIAQNPHGIAYEPLLGARVLLALAAFAQHKTHLALQTISEALRSAAPERFSRPFLEHCGGSTSKLTDGCAALLALARNVEKQSGESLAFLKELQRLTGCADTCSPAEIEALTTSASISPREQEVLRLLGSGASNGEMARRLSVSESTVKTHLRNIYTKLSVNSRVQALQKAKELKLIA